jgi:hypothetical protein
MYSAGNRGVAEARLSGDRAETERRPSGDQTETHWSLTSAAGLTTINSPTRSTNVTDHLVVTKESPPMNALMLSQAPSTNSELLIQTRSHLLHREHGVPLSQGLGDAWRDSYELYSEKIAPLLVEWT